MNTITLRISVLGDCAVGKTSLITRFADGTFTYCTNTTMHDMSVVRLQVEADTIKLIISDNSGIERSMQMARSFNIRADCFIFVYDVTDKGSFLNIHKWLKIINESCEENVPFLLVGNKMDLPYQQRQVSNQDIVSYMHVLGKEAVCFETSAKDDYNIKKVFYEAFKLTLKSHCMLVSGCENDLFIRLLDSKTNIVPEPERSLKKVIVSTRTDDKKIVVRTGSQKKESGCC